MARVDAKMRGPGIHPIAMASRSATSANPAPSVPSSRMVVNPAASVARAAPTARKVRSSRGSLSTWSFQGVSS